MFVAGAAACRSVHEEDVRTITRASQDHTQELHALKMVQWSFFLYVHQKSCNYRQLYNLKLPTRDVNVATTTRYNQRKYFSELRIITTEFQTIRTQED